MLALTLSLALLTPQGAGSVVINEFVYDDSSTDDREFVELFNPSATASVPIGGWTLAARDQVGPNPTYTVTAGTILGPRSFWVMGSGLVGNVNQIIGVQDLLENDQETLTLKDAAGNVIDSVVYEVNKNLFAITPPEREGEGLWGNQQSIDVYPTSWSRAVDGLDTDVNGNDFVLCPITPGASNNLTAVLPYKDNFDAASPETSPVEWGGSFALAYHIDPTVPSTNNPNAISASPQGGLALSLWDSAGGGNTNMLLYAVNGPVAFEALVYFDAALRPVGEFESWSIGIGCEGTFYNSPDPSGALGIGNGNGNNGVNWLYQVTDAGGTLYLIDNNDGGWGGSAVTTPTILGSIPIVQGVNDGWQRLRIERNATGVVGSFQNTPGCADGTTIAGNVAYQGPSTVWVGYREFVTLNGNVRPVTIDDVCVTIPTGSASTFGTAIATTRGTPTIGVNSAPTIGNSAWRVTLSGLVPSSATVLMLGATKQLPPFPLIVLGGQPGSELLIVPIITLNLPSDANGRASVPVPIACNPTFLGVSLFWQDFDLDLALPVTLPLGNSAGLDTKFGR